jgi:5'-deoxynucleotidase YfbR-like HD superfamily hydrolase
MKTDWIQTYTGKKFFPLDPDPEQICIEDIAHALSMQCRYAGHTNSFYSVAQHSVLLSREFGFLDYRLAALLHDASEAYLTDIPRPLKHLSAFAFYRIAEERLQMMIFAKYGLVLHAAGTVIKLIHQRDSEMIAHEAQQLMTPLHPDFRLPELTRDLIKIKSWSPQRAEGEFLMEFANLTEELGRQEAA